LVKSNPITIFGNHYRSVNNAATSLEVSKSSLLKIARQYGYSGHELDHAVKDLLKARRGMWKKSVTINGMTFESFSEAARYFGVTDRSVRYWVNQRGLNFEIDTTELEFEKLAKGSREHLKQLVDRANFTTKEDWYNKSRNTPDLLNLQKWLDKAEINLLDFLDEYFQEEPLQWWFMRKVPVGTWTDHGRVKQYLTWLAHILNFKDPEDWYQVTARDFKDNRGGSILTFHPSIIDIVQILHPTLKPWYFNKLPNSFWQNKTNHREFLVFLAENEQIVTAQDWYNKATKDVFHKYKGLSLLKEYQNVFECVSQNFPELSFDFWKFPKSRGNWESLSNQREYILWLGEQLGIANPVDWYNVTEQDFIDNHGITLLGQYYSSNIADCIMTILKDEYPWEKIRFYRNEYKREVRLYGIISCGLPNYTVQFRYKHPEIRHPNSGRKVEYDIFIEDLDAAIEYQGEQHYRPVDRFDGVDPDEAQKNFEHRQKTDQEKREQSNLNNVNLLEIKYSEWDGSLDYVLNIFNEKFGIQITRETVLNNASARGFVDNEIIFETD
jgi:hypothetical protein